MGICFCPSVPHLTIFNVIQHLVCCPFTQFRALINLIVYFLSNLEKGLFLSFMFLFLQSHTWENLPVSRNAPSRHPIFFSCATTTASAIISKTFYSVVEDHCSFIINHSWEEVSQMPHHTGDPLNDRISGNLCALL